MSARALKNLISVGKMRQAAVYFETRVKQVDGNHVPAVTDLVYAGFTNTAWHAVHRMSKKTDRCDLRNALITRKNNALQMYNVTFASIPLLTTTILGIMYTTGDVDCSLAAFVFGLGTIPWLNAAAVAQMDAVHNCTSAIATVVWVQRSIGDLE
jgi:hypothetical protein